MMDNNQKIEFTKNQLDRVLGFFPRADAKASVVLGIDIGILALLATNAPSPKSFEGYMVFAVIPVFLVVVSLWHLYQGSFPKLEGGTQSLIYFREIANRTESKYLEEFLAVEDDELIKDLLSQIWRNSEILKEKFDHLKLAYIFMASAVVPWAVTLAMFAIKNTAAQTLLK
jgi:hypothetical protein